MEMDKFIRRPFYVEAVVVTEENIAEVAEKIGELREGEGGVPYIQVNRDVVPNMHQVYLGFYMTKMGKNVRCYSPELFHEQFTPKTDAIDEWISFINKDVKPREVAHG